MAGKKKPSSKLNRPLLDPRRDVERGELANKLSAATFVRVLIVTVSLGALFLFAQPAEEIRSWHVGLIVVTYGLTIVYALMLRYRLALQALAYVQIVVDAALVTVLVALTRGIESVFAFVYVFTVLGASITLYRRGAIVAAICSFVLFGTVTLVQVDNEINLLPPVDFGHAIFSLFMYSVGIALVAWLSSTLAEKALITGRRLAERESDYEQLEELHAAILRSLPAGLMTIDGDLIVRYANDAAFSILAFDPADVINQPLDNVVRSMADRHRSENGALGPRTRERFEESFRRRDGRTIRLGFSFAPLGRPNPSGSIVVFQDVTEIVRLKDAYERAERLATVGKLAAGLAHEVRNPLASMCASIDVIKNAIQPPDSMKRLMNNVVSEADRLNALISDFLTFARPREVDRKLSDVSQLVASVVEVFKNDKILGSTKLELRLEENLIAAIDKDQMRQVIWNVAKNAAESMVGPSALAGQAAGQAGGKLLISTRSRRRTVEIIIRDTGPGIAADQLKRVFDPFFTTKDRGSGLGLAISHSIVEAHGGRILLESKLGEGTEVTIALDAAQPKDAPAIEEPAQTDLELLGLEPTAKMRHGL